MIIVTILNFNSFFEFLIKIQGSETKPLDRPRRWVEKNVSKNSYGANFAVQNCLSFTFFFENFKNIQFTIGASVGNPQDCKTDPSAVYSVVDV